MNSNQQLRAQIKAKRLALSAHAKTYAAGCIHKHLFVQPFFQQAQRIACYIDINGEVSTERILKMIINAGKQCYLPCLEAQTTQTTPCNVTHAADATTGKLCFAAYTPTTPMVNNCFDIPEPDLQVTECISADQLDLVLVPLVAFDQQGHRLGMGAGYYDRTFAFNKTNKNPVRLIGLAYQFQYSDQIQTFTHDIPLAGVVTETGCQLYLPTYR